MWVLTILGFSFLSAHSLAGAPCNGLPSLGEVEELAEVNCDLVDQRNSCAKSPQDPDALRKGITGLFERAMTDKARITQHWDDTYKATSLGQLFNEERRRNNRENPPEFILDWFKQENPDVQVEPLKEKIISSYLEFAQKNDCLPKIHTRFVVRSFPVPKFKTEQESRNAIRDLSSFQDFISKGRGENAINHLTACSDRPGQSHGPKRIVAYEYPPCTGNITQNFANNAWTISPTEAESIASSNSELSRCIQESLQKGAKIHHVSVVASASALNNTGAAKERFCAKGFKELSEARAQSAISAVLPRLLPDPALYAGDKLQVSTSGSNGDGTSGECPYRLVNGKEVLKPEFAPGGSRRAELDAGRYVRVVVSFQDKVKPENQNPSFYQPTLGCREISFRCR